MLLGWSASVGWITLLVETALVADADGVGIVVAGMHAYLILRACLVQLTVAFDVVVITYALAMESGVVAGPEHISGKPLIATCGTAMDYNKIDLSGHCSVFLD